MNKEQIIAAAKDLAKQKNYTEAQTTALVTLLEANDDTAKLIEPILSLPVARHSEYSSKLDALQKEKTDLTNWYNNTAQPWIQRVQTQLQEAQSTVERYKTAHGELDEDEDTPPNPKARKGTPNQDLADEIRAQQGRMANDVLAFQKDSSRLMSRHAKKFGNEILDLTPLLESIAGEQQRRQQMVSRGEQVQHLPEINLDWAYEQQYGEQLKQIEVKARETEVQTAVNKAVAEERKRFAAAGTRSGSNLDEDATKGVLWGQIKDASAKDAPKPPSEDELQNAFMADYQEGTQSPTTPAAGAGT